MQLQTPRAALPALGLDAGETSAIALALEVEARLLIDNKAGRTVARRLNIGVIGTAGVLALAKRQGVIATVRPVLDALIASGYFLGPDVVAQVPHAAGE